MGYVSVADSRPIDELRQLAPKSAVSCEITRNEPFRSRKVALFWYRKHVCNLLLVN